MQKSINTLTVKGQKEEADADNCLHILTICNNINNNVMYTTENNDYNNYYSIMCVHTHTNTHIILCVYYYTSCSNTSSVPMYSLPKY